MNGTMSNWNYISIIKNIIIRDIMIIVKCIWLCNILQTVGIQNYEWHRYLKVKW